MIERASVDPTVACLPSSDVWRLLSPLFQHASVEALRSRPDSPSTTSFCPFPHSGREWTGCATTGCAWWNSVTNNIHYLNV